MSINNRNYTGGAMQYSRNQSTVRLSVCGTTAGGNTVVSNYDMTPEQAMQQLEQWSQQLFEFWADERQRRIEEHKAEIERGDKIFRSNGGGWALYSRQIAG